MSKLIALITMPIAVLLIVLSVISFALLIVVTLPYTIFTNHQEPGYCTTWTAKFCGWIFAAGIWVGSLADWFDLWNMKRSGLS
jgi:hypothetical protein